MRVDYQRIADEAYERREEVGSNRLDRTTVVGFLLIGALALLPVVLWLVLLSDLSHQTLAQTLFGLLHAIGLRLSGL